MRSSGPSPASVGGAKWKRDREQVAKFRSWIPKIEEEIMEAAKRAEDYVSLYAICYGDGTTRYQTAVPAFWIERMVAEKAFTIECLRNFCDEQDIEIEFFDTVLGFKPKGSPRVNEESPGPSDVEGPSPSLRMR